MSSCTPIATGRSLNRRLRMAPLLMATYFMVSGGPYGMEELVAKSGYGLALVTLLILPLLWSLPTALMVAELASAVPSEGGFYVWVSRALGRFWGFQEAWLSLAASIFDMAIYPTLFVAYLAQIWPAARGQAAVPLGIAMVAVCVLWNLAGAPSVGRGAEWLGLLLLLPFAALAVAAFGRVPAAVASPTFTAPDLLGGLTIAMWNFMGWDNASTIAGEVERPQRAYPMAILGCLALVVATSLLPIAAANRAGVPPSLWSTGSWAEVAEFVVGPWLKIAMVVGGMVSTLGMCNALVLSYSRLPYVLAKDGYLPKAFLLTRQNGVPWVAVAACGGAWSASLGLSFSRLVMLDLMLYGLSLILEFAALIVLRRREPGLERPFRVPGGMLGAVLLGVPPVALIALGIVRAGQERLGPMSALQFGAILIALGPVLYYLVRRRASCAAAAAANCPDEPKEG